MLFRISLKGRKPGMPAAAAAGDIDFWKRKYLYNLFERVILKFI